MHVIDCIRLPGGLLLTLSRSESEKLEEQQKCVIDIKMGRNAI